MKSDMDDGMIAKLYTLLEVMDGNGLMIGLLVFALQLFLLGGV